MSSGEATVDRPAPSHYNLQGPDSCAIKVSEKGNESNAVRITSQDNWSRPRPLSRKLKRCVPPLFYMATNTARGGGIARRIGVVPAPTFVDGRKFFKYLLFSPRFVATPPPTAATPPWPQHTRRARRCLDNPCFHTLQSMDRASVRTAKPPSSTPPETAESD